MDDVLAASSFASSSMDSERDIHAIDAEWIPFHWHSCMTSRICCCCFNHLRQAIPEESCQTMEPQMNGGDADDGPPRSSSKAPSNADARLPLFVVAGVLLPSVSSLCISSLDQHPHWSSKAWWTPPSISVLHISCDIECATVPFACCDGVEAAHSNALE
jgi:hypothetical protein